MNADSKSVHIDADAHEYVTFEVAGQLFGIEVINIHDVFQPSSLTHVPMAPPEVRGVLNLRGRIVTAIDARQRLGLPPAETEADDNTIMAIGVEIDNESYGLIIDSVGEVLRLEGRDCETLPSNMDPLWQQISKGIYRLDDRLLIILNIEKMLNINQAAQQHAA